MDRPLLVVISGELGSGKTTLARPLAQRLGATLLSKDLLKESMYEALDLTTDRRSKAGSVAAMRLMYSIASTSASPLVLEANWKPMDVPQLAALSRPMVQLHCEAQPDVLSERVRGRERHPVHRDRTVPAVFDHVMAAIRSRVHEPLELPCPLIRVDTTEPVDLARLITAISDTTPA